MYFQRFYNLFTMSEQYSPEGLGLTPVRGERDESWLYLTWVRKYVPDMPAPLSRTETELVEVLKERSSLFRAMVTTANGYSVLNGVIKFEFGEGFRDSSGNITDDWLPVFYQELKSKTEDVSE
jgi:hypothetical protein